MNQTVLRAGAGSAPIRFPAETFPTDGIKTVHDDPYFRVLVLEAGVRAALCSAELVNVPDDGVALAKRLVSEITHTPEENIWIHMTHAISTPHAPYDPAVGGMAPPPDKRDPESPKRRAHYMAALESAVREAAEQAAATFTEAELSLGVGESHVNVNRDVETPFGWWLGHNPKGYSNKAVTVLRLDKKSGEPLGVVVSYGLKPCAIDNAEMDKGTRMVSSDVPGRAMLTLEQELGVPCLYFMSAAGDQVPREQAWYESCDEQGEVIRVDLGVQEGLRIVEKLGEELTNDLRPIIQAARPIALGEIHFGRTSVTWQTKRRAPMRPQRQVANTPDGEQEIGAELLTMGDVALVGTKPEINAVTEKQLQEGSPYGTTLLISFVNGGMKYMPDAESYDRITWESQSARLMRGAAEAWVEQTLKTLQDMKEGRA